MTFPRDRANWKKPGPRITPERHDEIMAALRAKPSDLECVAERFDISLNLVRIYAARLT